MDVIVAVLLGASAVPIVWTNSAFAAGAVVRHETPSEYCMSHALRSVITVPPRPGRLGVAAVSSAGFACRERHASASPHVDGSGHGEIHSRKGEVPEGKG